MNKLEELRTKLEQARKELNEKGYHYDSEMYSKGGYNELMKIKPFEIAYQDVIESIWPDEAWWKVTNYWDIFDAMAFEGFNDESIIDEIIKHVDSSFLEESCEIKEDSDESKTIKELESKYKCKFETGHKLSDWMRKYHEEYDNGELWDFSLEDFKSGAVEPQDGLVYWLIKEGDGELRAYETTEFCEECSESCKSLNEGTSNFGWLRIFPLLVFYTYDEVIDKCRYDSNYPQLDDFTEDKGNGDFHVDYDAYYDACDKFEQEYWDKIETAVLDESQVEELEDAIYNFNEETKKIANDLYDEGNEDDYYTLKDIEVTVEPGYYEAAYIYVPEKDFSYLSDEVKEAQLKRFHEFFDKLKNEHHLSHYEVAWGPASNGETGYRKVESLKEDEEDFDAFIEEVPGSCRAVYDGMDDWEYGEEIDDGDISEEDIEQLKNHEGQECNLTLDCKEDDFESSYWSVKFDDGYKLPGNLRGNYFTRIDDIEESKKKDDCHVNTNAGDPIKNAEFFNANMGTSSEGSVGEDLEEENKQVTEDLKISTGDTEIHVDPLDAVTTVQSNEGTVVVQSNGDVTVHTDDADISKEGDEVKVDVKQETSIEEPVVADVTVAEPETAPEEVVSTEGESEMITDDETIDTLDKGIDVNTDEVQEESLKEENHVCEKCGKNPCECDKQDLKEEPIHSLDTRYDNANSFYGKAKVDVRDDGSQILYSYNTPVCMITKDGEVKLLRKGYLGWFSSPTTLRHVKEFLKQNNKEVGTKKELNKMYSTEDAYNYVK